MASSYFRSAEARDRAVLSIIQEYCGDDGGGPSPEKSPALANRPTLRQRSSADELDEEGCNGEGTYWGEWDTIYNYELISLPVGPGDTAAPEHSITAMLKHSTKENKDCPSWCKTYAAEIKQRALLEANK